MLHDKASLIATLGELRASRIAEIVAELKWSKAGTKKVDKLKKELVKTQKAIAHCVAETVFN
jgi:predicted transcriptional regulator